MKRWTERAVIFFCIGLPAAAICYSLLDGGMVMGTGGKGAEAMNETRNLVNAISMYELEYGILPLPEGTTTDQTIKSGGSLITLLTGGNLNRQNPREKVFFEAKRAKGIDEGEPRGGIVLGEGSSNTALYDSWGNLYTVVIDGDGNGLVTDPRTGAAIKKTTIAFSHGRDLTTLKDDYLSWK